MNVASSNEQDVRILIGYGVWSIWKTVLRQKKKKKLSVQGNSTGPNFFSADPKLFSRFVKKKKKKKIFMKILTQTFASLKTLCGFYDIHTQQIERKFQIKKR